MISLVRIFKFAFQDIGRNLGISFMTVFILVLMLFSVNTLWSVKILTNEAVGLVKDQINVSIYLLSNVSDKEVEEIKNYLQDIPEVESLKVLSPNEVLQSFEKRHSMSLEVLEALKELGGNPFGPTIVVKTKEPGNYKEVISLLDASPYKQFIETRSFEGNEDAIIRLQNITNRIENVGLGLSLLFAFIAFMIVFNMVRVAIYTHRIEISIKRLVGAHNWFIRGPYLVESFIFTILSIFVTGIILYWFLHWIDPYIGVVFPSGFSLTNYYKSNILYLSLVQIVAVLLLTIFSSTLAMRKQLKV